MKNLFSFLCIVCAFFYIPAHAATDNDFRPPSPRPASPGVPRPSPAGVSGNLALWLDASDPNANANGTLPSSGELLTTWKDKSGQGNNAIVMEGQNAATYVENQLNGKATLFFTRVADNMGSFYQVPGLDIRAITNPDVTIFSVYRTGPHAPNDFMAVWGNDNGGWDRFFLPTWGQGENGAASYGPFPPYAANVIGSGTTGKTRLLTAVYDGDVNEGQNYGPENSSAIYFNGQLVSAFTDRTEDAEALGAFGVGFDGDNSAFTGDIAEIIVYNRKLTACEIQKVNKYLGDKYGENFSGVSISLGSENTTLCPGSSITLTASAGETYKWLKDGVAIADATTSTYTTIATGKYRVVVEGALGCPDTSAVVELTASAISAAITAADVTTFCSGGSVEISAPANMESYEWYIDGNYAGMFSQTVNADSEGSYTVKVIDKGCSATTDVDHAVKVTVYNNPSREIAYEGEPVFCEGGSLQLTAAENMVSYQWYFDGEKITGASSSEYVATQTGKYTIGLENDKGCVSEPNSEFGVKVRANPLPVPELAVEGPLAICNGSQVTLTTQGDMGQYEWFRNGTPVVNDGNSLTTGTPGKYSVKITDDNSCSATSDNDQAKTISLKPDLAVSVNIAGTPVQACPGTPVTITATAVNGGTQPLYEWTLNNAPVDNNTNIFQSSALKLGDIIKVKLTSNDDVGCISNFTASSAPFTFKLNTTQDCDNDGIANGTECPSGYNCPDKDGDGTPDYLDTDSDGDGSSDKQEGTTDCNRDGVPDYLDAKACFTNIALPNLFSPNGDGVNDVIRPIIPGIKTFGYLKIYNRWGNLVFESKDPNKGWDGNLNGKLQPQDTYIWVATGGDSNGAAVTQKGMISLIR